MTLAGFQSEVRKILRGGKSLLLVAPTGLGKTLAVTADLQDAFRKTVYAVPLRALCGGIKKEVSQLTRPGRPIQPVIHHGDTQESNLFGEEVVVTTYDQVVCATPGLPLSLPLKAGHAIAGALLMSRLILDEAHLAWGISERALSILLAIIDFRTKLGIQTVVQTATLPKAVAKKLSKELRLSLVIFEGETLHVVENDGTETVQESTDEALQRREANRCVTLSSLELQKSGKTEQKQLDWSPLDTRLAEAQGKRIYFSNTVRGIQETYDRLLDLGVESDSITVLHNRMPRTWRQKAETDAIDRFGKMSPDGNWLLLTNQVAEAGLDISAPLVISDPAPVDTLVQRAGRCARWFRTNRTTGEFMVVTAAKDYIDDPRNGLALPYRKGLVHAALDSLPIGHFGWNEECTWVDKAWAGGPEGASDAVKQALDETAFALNLFDRAAQRRRPGEIADAFREILSVEIAVEEANSTRDLQELIDEGRYPETSSVSLGQAWGLFRKANSNARAIRYEEGALRAAKAGYVQPGDVLVVSSDVAILHPKKGLCFDGLEGDGVERQSEWDPNEKTDRSLSRESGRRQGLLEHTREVMRGTYERLMADTSYRTSLIGILTSLEGKETAGDLADMIAQIATVAAGFHDLGKADTKWQARARGIDPTFKAGLIGRTANPKGRIGRPHTPPGFKATLKACEILIGCIDAAEHLIRAVALASARHHSSLTNPALVEYKFEPSKEANRFVEQVLKEVGADEAAWRRADEIIQAARERPGPELVPLALPNDDLFPIYALVGRAILMADRESAAGCRLEERPQETS